MLPFIPSRPKPVSSIESLPAHIEYVAEIKKNGWRCLLDTCSRTHTAWSRHGSKLQGVAALKQVPQGFVFDGELVGDIFYCFDVPVVDKAWHGHVPYMLRKELLVDIIKDSKNIELLKYGIPSQVWYTMQPEDEGIVCKPLMSEYKPGENYTWLKIRR